MGKSGSKLATIHQSFDNNQNTSQSTNFHDRTIRHQDSSNSTLSVKSVGATTAFSQSSSRGLITNEDYSICEADLLKWCRTFDKKYSRDDLKNLLHNNELLAPFLTDVFCQEVEISDCVKTLFRGNSLASRIMSHCFKIFGSRYLKQILEPHIKPLLFDSDKLVEKKTALKRFSSLQSGRSHAYSQTTSLTCDTNNDIDSLCDSMAKSTAISYEIDSAKLEEDGDISVNQRNLLRLTRRILNSILSSSSSFPYELTIMLECLKNVLCEKYPQACNNNLNAVGTVIFLRFINPAIVAPYEAGIVDKQPSSKTLRGLMLVSKILQNTANNVEFSKEHHMLPFNDFLREQFEPLRQWVAHISSTADQKQHKVNQNYSNHYENV